MLEMRRHYANYLKGLPNIKEYRIKLTTLKNTEDILDLLNEINQTYSGYHFHQREIDMAGMAYSCG